MDRRTWMKLAATAGAAAAVSGSGIVAQTARPAPRRNTPLDIPEPKDWTGHNRALDRYYRAPGYPAFDPHPRYLGELAGSWHAMGLQYGERAGDLIRMVYEGWYRELLPIQGSPEVMAEYLHHQNAYYELLVPEALEFMHGLADGAATELQRSAFPHELTNFEKILMINSYFGLQGKPPHSATAELAPEEDDFHCCSGAIMLPASTGSKTIHCSSEDQHFFPQEYLVTFIARPSDKRAHRFTVTDSAGEIGSEHAMNERGVAVSGYAGGGMGILAPTLAQPFSGYRRPGLDWQVGNFYATSFGDSARHAVELLTVGRPEYRAKSGYKIVIGKCTRGANWMVSDAQHAFVVESIPADQHGTARYAIRKPGDMGERNAAYIVSTNNVEARDSYNEDNAYDPGHPMRQHGNAEQRPSYFGLNITGTRFWTFMWLIRRHYGAITPATVQGWRRTHFVLDRTGVRHDTVPVDGREVPTHLVPRIGTLCWHASGPAGVDTFKGIDVYVTLSTAQDRTTFRTKGRPCEWQGPWDELRLS
ncbi:MAG: hypothetical protein EPN33_03395 [Acidobacteria bacterium]|nr:MAG: hypothetical protein EPN33_03395 [Acidobacteriota bacterium]